MFLSEATAIPLGVWFALHVSQTGGRSQSWEASVYLVDPASSHMLVSKIKPCKSKYALSYSETANGSLNQLWFI